MALLCNAIALGTAAPSATQDAVELGVCLPRPQDFLEKVDVKTFDVAEQAGAVTPVEDRCERLLTPSMVHAMNSLGSKVNLVDDDSLDEELSAVSPSAISMVFHLARYAVAWQSCLATKETLTAEKFDVLEDPFQLKAFAVAVAALQGMKIPDPDRDILYYIILYCILYYTML